VVDLDLDIYQINDYCLYYDLYVMVHMMKLKMSTPQDNPRFCKLLFVTPYPGKSVSMS